MTTTTTNAYTPTKSECIELFAHDKLRPDHKYSISLLLLAVLVAVMFYLLQPLIGGDASKSTILQSGYLFAGAAGLAGILFWRSEGKMAVRRKTRDFERTYAAYMTEMRFSFDNEEWTLQREGKSEDKRKFAELKIYREGPSAIALVTNAVHIVPRSALASENLATLPRQCGMESADEKTRPAATRLDHCLSAAEYMFWRQRSLLFGFLISSLTIAALCGVRMEAGPRSGLEEIHISWLKLIGAMVAVFCLAVSEGAFRTSRRHKGVRFGRIDGTGYTGTEAETKAESRVQWLFFTNAREGWSSFYFEPLPLHYVAFHKRILSAAEKALLRQKTGEIRAKSSE